MNAYDDQAERDHLINEASKLFPNSTISLEYGDQYEEIHLYIDGARYTFNVGSDDDVFVFYAGNNRIVIPALD